MLNQISRTIKRKELSHVLSNILKKKEKLDVSLPMPKDTLQMLQEKLYLEWTYHSNAIEGNTLTLQDIEVVLAGTTVGGKTIREHLEVINHENAIRYVEEIVINQESLSERQIKNIHRLVLKGIIDGSAGVYREDQVYILGAGHVPPAANVIIEKMEEMMDWYQKAEVNHHVIERAAMLHTIFVGIHPFIDGNGRTARLLLNLELMKNGYPPVIIKVENRLAYYDALDKAHTKRDFGDFISIVAAEVEDSLDLYLKEIELLREMNNK